MHEVLVSIPAGGVLGGKMGCDMWRTFLKAHGRFRNRIGPQALCIGYQVVGFILVKVHGVHSCLHSCSAKSL